MYIEAESSRPVSSLGNMVYNFQLWLVAGGATNNAGSYTQIGTTSRRLSHRLPALGNSTERSLSPVP